MRIPFFSLRVSVIIQLSLLILAAMLLCDVVMIRFAERDLIRARIREARLLAIALEGRMTGSDEMEDGSLRTIALELLRETGFQSIVVADYMGETLLNVRETLLGDPGNHSASAIRVSGIIREEVEFKGRTWAVMSFGPESVRVTVPVRLGTGVPAGISIQGSLVPLYAQLREAQKLLLLYVFINTLAFSLAGMVLLSRTVVRPIRKLLKMTEEYRGGDFLVPLDASSGSEIRKLSLSLGNMLGRLEENKDALSKHIASLEQANQDLRRAQDELVRSEKLASVGRLAAGLAHEIGNPIGIILGYLDLLRRTDLSEAEKSDIVSRVDSEVNRVNLVIRSLLDYSRVSDNRFGKTSVHELIQDTMDMLKPQPIMENVRVDFFPAAGSDEVFADPGRLRQVFVNVLMNAADALFAVRDRLTGSEKPAIRVETRNVEGGIEVTVSDNGPGIPREHLSRVFDPFYTTKDPGKGTGLGLSVSHRIMEDLGGTIVLKSFSGSGTAAIVQLPLCSCSENRS